MRSILRRLKSRLSAHPEESPQPEGKWSIGIYSGPSPLDLKGEGAVHNPVLTAADVDDAVANFVADPFMIRHDSTWYLFFEVEVVESRGNIGKIGLATSRDGVVWTYEKIVLEAPVHLSYPHVFRWGDDYFMIPETRSLRSVQLYRALDFPTSWKQEKTLLKGRRYADASVLRYDDRWWMFTDSGNTTLRLYTAAELDGRWSEHPGSPILKKNPSLARPGGRVIVVGGHPMRFAQDCFPYYGKQVWGFRITELTPTTYREEPIRAPVLQPGGAGWNRFGMHTVDAHRLDDGSWLACVDGFGDDRRP